MPSSNFRVHLIFSEEGQRIVKLENRYEVYGIALLPFALNVPPEQVDFTVNPVIVEDPNFLLLEANRLPLVKKTTDFLKDATTTSRRCAGVPRRVLTIYGMQTPARSAVLRGTDFPARNVEGLLGRAVPRIWRSSSVNPHHCGCLQLSVFLVAALDGHYINNDATTAAEEPRKCCGRKLNKRSQFVDNCASASFACDNNDLPTLSVSRRGPSLRMRQRMGRLCQNPLGTESFVVFFWLPAIWNKTVRLTNSSMNCLLRGSGATRPIF